MKSKTSKICVIFFLYFFQKYRCLQIMTIHFKSGKNIVQIYNRKGDRQINTVKYTQKKNTKLKKGLNESMK